VNYEDQNEWEEIKSYYNEDSEVEDNIMWVGRPVSDVKRGGITNSLLLHTREFSKTRLLYGIKKNRLKILIKRAKNNLFKFDILSSFLDRRFQTITSYLNIGFSHALKISANSTIKFEGFVQREKFMKLKDSTKDCFLNGKAKVSLDKIVKLGDTIQINPSTYVNKYTNLLDHLYWVKFLSPVARLVYSLDLLCVPFFFGTLF